MHNSVLTVSDREVEKKTVELQEIWGETGVKLNDIHEIETKMGYAINLYSFEEDASCVPLFVSEVSDRPIVMLNVYNNHISYVTNVNGYVKKYECTSCERHITTLRSFNRHQGTCASAIRNVYNLGHFKPPADIFRKLECERVIVAEEDRFFPRFATWDIERILMKCQESTKCTRWVRKQSVLHFHGVEYS